MGFADFAVGFAGGFANETVRQKDRQADEDSRIVELSLTSMAAKAKTMSEVEREQETLLRNATNLQRITGGAADTGTFFEELRLGLTPAQILENLEKNPNRYVPIGTGSTETPTSAPLQTNFDIGAAAVGQFGGPTKEAATAMDSAIASRPTAPASNLGEQDIDLLTRTIIGEAASEPQEGQAAVASVVLNRLNSGQYGGTVRDVLFARNQFQPWTEAETRERLLNIPTDSPEYQNARRVAEAVVSGQVPDFSQGALNFANPEVVRQYADSGKATPATLSWVEDVAQNGVRIGNHVFGTPGSQPGANGVQVARNDFSPTDTQMADSGLANPTGTAPVQEPEQEQSGFDRFRSGTQRLFGMDTESRQARIQEQVDAGRSALGLDNVSNEGFAVPPSNFRINVGSGGGVDLTTLVGKDAEFIDGFVVVNSDKLAPEQMEAINTLRGIATRTEQKPFDVFSEIRNATTDGQFTAVSEFVRLSPEFTDEERANNMAVIQDSQNYRNQAETGNLMDQYQNDLVRYQRMLVQGTDTEREEASRWFNEERPIIENALGAAGQIDARSEASILEGLGFNPDIAMLAALGKLEVITDPIDRSHRVIDAAGNVISTVDASDTGNMGSVTELANSEYAAARDAADNTMQTLLQEMQGADLSEGLGIPGRLKNFANTVAGALGSDTSSYPETASAYRLMETLDVYTRLIVTQSLTNLRGSVYVLELLQELNLAPGEFTTADGAKQRLSTVRQKLQDDVTNLENVASGEMGVNPAAVSDARAALPDMRTLLSYYEAMEQSFDNGGQQPSGQNFLGNQQTDTPAAPAQEQPTVSIPAGAIDMLKQNADNPTILRAFEDKYGVSATQYLNGGQ